MDDSAQVRSKLDEIFRKAAVFRTSKEYADLLHFVSKMKHFAPFNAMLLQVQKPGLTHAASPEQWAAFGRRVKEGARPLLIMWPFSPVALVYDIQDTEGRALPAHAFSFPAIGEMTEQLLQGMLAALPIHGIEVYLVDAGDGSAGWIKMIDEPTQETSAKYRLALNRNHEPQTRFVTVAHELAHLFLGHLGKDGKFGIPDRTKLTHAERELEAESVAYVVCEKHGVQSRSESYLSNFLKDETAINTIDVYPVMRAIGRVEGILGLAHYKGFG